MEGKTEPTPGETCETSNLNVDSKPETELGTGEEVSTEICKFYLVNKCRFGEKCLNLHEGEVLEEKEKPKKPERTERTEKVKGKKPPMKTALDVIKRIKWDSDFTQVS